jgi:large subunit ribosomal protein L29
MKALELKEKTEEELAKLLQEKQAKLVKVKFGVASKQYKNYKEIADIKKDIARINTALNSNDSK